MKAVMTMLSESEIEKIHESSLDILEKVGVKVASDKVRRMLVQFGCREEGEIIRMPRDRVMEAIRMAPNSFTLAARDPGKSLRLPAGEFPYSSTGGYAPFVHDLETGKSRKSTGNDLRDFCVVADYLDCLDYFWPIVMPTDQEPAMEEYAGLDIAFRNITKHIQMTSSTEKTSLWHIRLASLVAGGEDKLRKAPLFSAVASPNTPLSLEKDVVESMAVLAAAGVPLAPMNVPLGGTTAPITLAGTLAVGNAEQLATLVVVKSANQDAPMIYSSDMGIADMRTGAVNYNSVEYPLLCSAAAQLTDFYGMPGLVSHGSSEERPYDLASMERSVSRVVMSLMTRTDCSAWMGSEDNCLGGSLTGFLMDAEILTRAKGYLKEYHVDDDAVGLPAIAEAGPGGNFLVSQHTMDHLRQEIWTYRPEQSVVLNRDLSGDYKDIARESVREILKKHQPVRLSADMEKEMDKLMSEAHQDICS